MWQQIINFLFPTTCLFCHELGSYVCDNCQAVILETNYDAIHVPNIDRLTIGFRYNRGIELLWHWAKHDGYYTIADFLGTILLPAILARDQHFFKDTTIIPIPVSRHKLRERGFNQVERMFRGMKSVNGELLFSDCLVRTADTKTQIGQNQSQRRQNLAGKFALKPEVKLTKKVILIDDITTTGATLSECAKVLRRSGIETVEALVFARG